MKIDINNMPENPNRYIVVRRDEADNSLWYWGSWNDKGDAVISAIDVEGMVFDREALNDNTRED